MLSGSGNHFWSCFSLNDSLVGWVMQCCLRPYGTAGVGDRVVLGLNLWPWASEFALQPLDLLQAWVIVNLCGWFFSMKNGSTFFSTLSTIFISKYYLKKGDYFFLFCCTIKFSSSVLEISKFTSAFSRIHSLVPFHVEVIKVGTTDSSWMLIHGYELQTQMIHVCDLLRGLEMV